MVEETGRAEIRKHTKMNTEFTAEREKRERDERREFSPQEIRFACGASLVV